MDSESSNDVADHRADLRGASNPILIREIALADAETAAHLSAELGYPTNLAEMSQRIERIASSRNQIVYVACLSNVILGWIDAAILYHLSTGAFGEIGGLIVSSEYRSRGIGRELVAQAERWVADHGVSRMVVRSRTTREAAHRFYLREGYSQTKTSAVFSKQLNG